MVCKADNTTFAQAEGARQRYYRARNNVYACCSGDSAAAGVEQCINAEAIVRQLTAELAAQFEVSWLLIAKTGFTTADLLAHLANVCQHFDVAVVSLGVNDVTRRVATRHWLKQQQVVELLATKFGVQKCCCRVYQLGHFALKPLRWYVGLYAKQFNPIKSILITMRMVWFLPTARFESEFWYGFGLSNWL